jgi:heme O synthase-like polyprenyltransferase
MLPQADRSGRWTWLATVLHSMLLIPIAGAITLLGLAGWTYGAGAALLGVLMVWQSVRLLRAGTRQAARRVFLTSLLYLPVLLGLMVLDAPGRVRDTDRALLARAASQPGAGPAADQTPLRQPGGMP